MKYKIILMLILIGTFINETNGQNNWSFVGPYSNNNLSGTEYQTSQMNRIIVDPNNPQHLFAAGKFGGLWESNNNGAKWFNINTSIPLGVNGVLAMDFKSASEILIANYEPHHSGLTLADNRSKAFSDRISIYNFQSQAWTNLPPLPNPSGLIYTINSLAVNPANKSIYYAGTTIGLFRYETNTWTLIVPNCHVESIVFIQKLNLIIYECFISGSVGSNWNDNTLNAKPSGVPMLKKSTDNDNKIFIDLSNQIPLSAGYNVGHSKLTVEYIDPINPPLTNPKLFLMTHQLSTSNPTLNHNRLLYQITLDQSTQPCGISYNLLNSYDDLYKSGIERMSLAYDPLNNFLWTGGVRLGCFNINTNQYSTDIKQSFETKNGNIHDDFHQFTMQNNGGVYTMYVAHDGGLAKTPISASADPSSAVTFTRINDNVNVCLINGFSGSEQDPNLYGIGQQDITKTDIYDASTFRDRYTHNTWENDGVFIDKFNDNFMILDNSSYDFYTQVSKDKGQTITSNSFNVLPKTTAPFESSTNIYTTGVPEYPYGRGSFGFARYKQDPYRKDRLYELGMIFQPQLFKYDFKADRWVYVTSFQYQGAYNTAPDNLSHWSSCIVDMSFSPESENSVHIAIGGNYDLQEGDAPGEIYKYIGPNINDSYYGHNERFDALGNPQWQNISPNYATFSSIGGGAINITSANDLSKITFMGLEASKWDKNRIYVGCSMNITGPNVNVKVLKYDGTSWSNYSNGIPANEIVTSMVMDHNSNDGIYLSTNRGVYYRDRSSTSWVNYNYGLPILKTSQMEINYAENTVRVGTYGRGIWKSQLVCPSIPNQTLSGSINPDIYEAKNTITASGPLTMSSGAGPTVFRAGDEVRLLPGFSVNGNANPNTYFTAFIHGCSFGTKTSPNLFKKASPTDSTIHEEKVINSHNKFNCYPNPNNGIFEVSLPNDETYTIEVFDLIGKKIFSKANCSSNKIDINLSEQTKGFYIIQVFNTNQTQTQKLIIQ
ncbi:MAG: T9SS type A sorting domain-containing protein [Bacteroidota bacterium]